MAVGMTDQDKILQFLRFGGPTLPGKVAKNLQTDTLLASAHLADLVSQRKVRVSNLKVGGSPLYYLPGQEEKLVAFAAGNVNPKDLEVLEILQKKKLLREKGLELLPRVALRSLKDFAVPLQVTVQGEKELFWKWHLVADVEMQELLKVYFPEKPQELAPSSSQPKQPPVLLETAAVQQKAVPSTPEAAAEHLFSPPLHPSPLRAPPSAVAPEIVPRAKRTHHASVHGKASTPTQQTLPSATEAIPAGEPLQNKPDTAERKPFLAKLKEKISRKKSGTAVSESSLSLALDDFLQSLQISIESKETVRKDAEMDLLVKVPSPVGEVTYFCKARKKKRCDEKDISAAYVEAQLKKLPLLFVYSDELSKKAQDLVASHELQNVVVKKITLAGD